MPDDQAAHPNHDAADNQSAITETEVFILGAGVCGIATAVRCVQDRIDFVMIDRATRVGGTWHHNRYPGCAVDIPSHLYSFSFAPNPDWTRVYSPAAEVQQYLEQVVDDFGVRPHIRLEEELFDASWDDELRRWVVTTSRGIYRARAFVSAAGPLHDPVIPDFPGRESFRGNMFHSSEWPEDDQLDGKNVVVIGTGASAIQFVPAIAPRVASMTVLQRTPSWVMPKPDWDISDTQKRVLRRLPVLLRLWRCAQWGPMDLFTHVATRNHRAARALGKVCSWHMRRSVKDPKARALLTPSYEPTCKRLGFSNDYFPTFARPNVTLTAGSAAQMTEDAVITADGTALPADVVIFGTGFHTLQHHPINSRIHGRGGASLEDTWAGSPTAYMGTSVHGFPNLFTMFGPNIGTLSGFVMAEAQTDLVMSILRTLRDRGLAGLDVRQSAVDEFVREMDELNADTTFTTGGCTSYYLADANGRPGRASLPWGRSMTTLTRTLKTFDAEAYVPIEEPSGRLSPDRPTPTTLSA